MELTEVFELEKNMWEAAKNRDADAFLNLVNEDAVMVCGGFRCTGKEYAGIIAEFDCKSYETEHFEIVNMSRDSIQVHYMIRLETEDSKNSDLGGVFHITTTRIHAEGKWKVVFNMDHKTAE